MLAKLLKSCMVEDDSMSFDHRISGPRIRVHKSVGGMENRAKGGEVGTRSVRQRTDLSIESSIMKSFFDHLIIPRLLIYS